jgi:hypothetical protein
LQYNAQDVKNILTILAEDFLVDVPARHTDGDYLIEYHTLVNTLTLAEDGWYESIASTTNETIIAFG